jgi:hypothetical protein
MNLSIYCAFVGGSRRLIIHRNQIEKNVHITLMYISISLFPKNIKRRDCVERIFLSFPPYIYIPARDYTRESRVYIHYIIAPFLFSIEYANVCPSGTILRPGFFYTDPDWISKRERNSHQCPSFFHIRSYTVHTHLYRFLITKWPADDKTSKVVNHLPWRKNRPGLVIKRKILETYFYNNPYCWLVGQGVSPVRIRFDIFVGWGGGYCVCLREKVSTCLCVCVPSTPTEKVFTSYEQGVYNVLLLRYYIYLYVCHTQI